MQTVYWRGFGQPNAGQGGGGKGGNGGGKGGNGQGKGNGNNGNGNGGGGGGTDPYYANVSLLSHFDSSSGGTPNFVDNSQYGHTISGMSSGPVYSTAWAKFGTGSCRNAVNNASLSRCEVAHHASFVMGTDEFTLEIFVRLTSIAASAIILNKASATSYYPYQLFFDQASGKFMFRCFTYTAGNFLQGPYTALGTTTVQADTDYFLQARRRNTGVATDCVFELAVNGSLEGTSNTFNNGERAYDGDPTSPLCIGNFSSGANFPVIGYYDECRITKGVARAFGVPTSAFPNS